MAEDRNKSGSACEKDPLTGLIGRQEFLQKVDNVIKGNKSCTACDNHTLVYFNLLNFKLINLTFGTDAGDDCLRQLADILKKYFKKTFLSRFSDDHFMALTEQKDIVETVTLIYKECSDANLHVNIGIRHIDESIPENNAVGVCDQAKIACDSIQKDAVRFYAIYNDEIRQNLERDTYITENLEDAIRRGCIQIYFQPILRSLTGKVCGMEALTRWVDSDRGIMSPNNFVFSDPFHELETVVKKYKLHRDFFCIEITESVLMSRKYDAVGFLNILTEKPTAIFLSRGDEVRILLANPAYKKVLESIGGREEKEPNPFTAWVEMNF